MTAEEHDFTTVPEGTYRVRIAEVRERETRNGDAIWALRLVVAAGEYEGRTAAWDNLVFSTRGVHRVKVVHQALGVQPVSAQSLVGREADVQVRRAEYLSPTADPVTVVRNEVPWNGWAAPGAEGGEV